MRLITTRSVNALCGDLMEQSLSGLTWPVHSVHRPGQATQALCSVDFKDRRGVAARNREGFAALANNILAQSSLGLKICVEAY